MIDKAIELRRQWMRLIGCDEQEIASSIKQDQPVDAERERREVDAAIAIHDHTLGREIISSLSEFNKKLRDGEPIKCVRITRHDTPDGPMHTQEDVDI